MKARVFVSWPAIVSPRSAARRSATLLVEDAHLRACVFDEEKKKSRTATISAAPPAVVAICVGSIVQPRLSRRLFVSTDTLENDMAPAAIIGLSNQPVIG